MQLIVSHCLLPNLKMPTQPELCVRPAQGSARKTQPSRVTKGLLFFSKSTRNGSKPSVCLPSAQPVVVLICGMLLSSGVCCAGQSDRDSGPTGSLQEAAERASSTEGSLVQAGEPSMPLPGARSLSDGQLDSLMGQLAGMPDEKGRKDLLGVCDSAYWVLHGALPHNAVLHHHCSTH